ncbi:MAG TPA: alpha/beta hydrolase [Xanthobacteraceae bacterium]|jgi:pimeloyl-ACP methyl ester carboxylesterase|nr:alpha/beta hydrolase [Xanthobacteraceae bacterium]
MRRREFVINLGSVAAWPLVVQAQQAPPPERGGTLPAPVTLKRVRTKTLEIAYEESGPEAGTPVLLMHGFPYDPRAYDEVVPILVAAGCRTIVPYLRGYGPTRFLSADTPRSGQQAAVGRDLLDLMDALGLQTAALVGFDWGGRAACVVAALWPERVRCLVLANGYSIQNIAASVEPRLPEQEHRAWYQFYFHTERGRAGLAAHRRELGKLLWQLWSPNWKFDDATYERTAKSFDNPDYVDIVIHSYRHRFGYAPGDPDLEPIERRLAATPPIPVPTIVIHGGGDGVSGPPNPQSQTRYFTGPVQHRVIPLIGHDIPQEAPAAVAAAVLDLLSPQRSGERRGG